VPARAEGLELLGPVAGSGHRAPPSLVRRVDGQTLQLTPVLYAVLEAVDGARDAGGIADELERRAGVAVEPADVERLVEERLRPLGVLRNHDGSQPAVARTNPLLALRLRLVVSNPAVTGRLTRPVAWLFAPPVVALVAVAFLGVSGWLLLQEGLAPAARQVLYEPRLLLLVFALTMLSAGFHELGHAAACRYGGARPGAMGVGLYLVWPAFYTDVSDSYRLPKRDRLRVDLGGIYFNAVFAVGVFAVAVATGWHALLVVIPLQQLQMLQQLAPFVRLDGYHILADLVGVPDLYAHIKPTLLGWLPGRHRDRVGRRRLRRWARWVITAWVLVVVPVLAFGLLLLVVTLPRLAATAADSTGRQLSAVAAAWSEADLAAAGLRLIGVAAIAVPLLSSTYLLSRIARRTVRRAWAATQGRDGARAGLAVAAVALAVFAAVAWWPRGQYEPISEDEQGTLVDGVRAVVSADAAAPQPASVGSVLRTEDGVLVPLPLLASPGGEGELAGVRFGLPTAPRPGDNQALAVNQVDGATVVDVALSLVWGDGSADNRNQAYALANCRGCTTAAFAFQVVLIVGDAEVVVPQNVAVALNALCDGCVTRAIAVQLVATLARPLDGNAMLRLGAIWRDLQAVAGRAGTAPLAETEQAIRAAEAQILAVLEPYLVTAATASASDEPSSTTSTSSTTTVTTAETWSWSVSPSPSPSTTTPEPSSSTTTTVGEATTTTPTTTDPGTSTSTTTTEPEPDPTTTTTAAG